MNDKKGKNYTIVAGDTLSAIASRHNVASWKVIYNHEKNAAFREKRPDPNRIQPGDVLWVPLKGDVVSSTNNSVVIQETCMRILFDAHMHIQSNNCCPLPLQWALVAKNFFASTIKGRPGSDDRKKINDSAASMKTGLFVGRLGKVGRMDTGLISDMFIGNANAEDIKEGILWTVLTYEEQKRITQGLSEEEGTRRLQEEAARRFQLRNLQSQNYKKYLEFSDYTKQYYSGMDIFRMHIALPMDLSFGHYWGRFGLPVNLNTNGGMYYINDFVAINIVTSSFSANEPCVTVSPNSITPYYAGEEPCSIPVISPYQSYQLYQSHHHLWALCLNGDKEQEICSIYKQLEKNIAVRNVRSPVLPSSHKHYIKFTGDLEKIRNTIQTPDGKIKACHLVERIPGKETEWFESFTQQLGNTISAAVQYPFEYFIFYHYDPRRHYVPGKDAPSGFSWSEPWESALKANAFFTYEIDDKSIVKYDDGGSITGALKLSLSKELNDPDILKAIIDNVRRKNGDVYPELFKHSQNKNGPYWGVKMYPRLGFTPNDFNRYPHLRDFYENCQSNKIPITFHCSRGGMSIADYFNYERYDAQKVKNRYDLHEAEEYFDSRGHTPAHWESVLKEFPTLKICMAH
ncbi:MAG: LysM peptidoglycan-binding domain-containing protein, partial [Chitinivibrionales bacterium]|nr:LysM peptidoglycan-binding domain-containing protein [Chitinivibrionales bacterium]